MKSLYFLITCLLTGSTFAADLTPVHLRCEYLENPMGIDITRPRLSWRVESDARGQTQSAYRVLVASSSEMLASDEGDVWDSGIVDSSQSLFIQYEGEPLASRRQCFWKVQALSADGSASWSKPASWSMGLLQQSDWQADYISYRDDSAIHTDTRRLFLPAARQYRKEFAARKEIKQATLYATALGIYELQVNGERVGDAMFAPGWTDYRQRAYYNTYDVTDMLAPGDNAVGAWVADGWYSGYVGFGLLTGMGTEKNGRYTYGKTPSVMVQLEIEYTDGTRATIGTDPTWKVTGDGPIQEADMLMGEAYDARKEMPGWSAAGFDDSGWDAAILASDNGHPTAMFYEGRNPETGGGPKITGVERDLGFKRPTLEAFPGVPVRVTQELPAKSVNKRAEGTYTFDLAQNFAGTIRLKVKGPAGHKVTIRYGEMLHPDGTPTKCDRELLNVDDLVLVKGGERERGKLASRAAKAHQTIYARHPGVEAIVFAHPVNSTAFSVTDSNLDVRTIPESYVFLRDVKRVPYGTQYRDDGEIADYVSEKSPAAMLENDGVIVTGRSVLDTFDRLEVLESTAEAVINARSIGQISAMPDAVIDELCAAFNLA